MTDSTAPLTQALRNSLMALAQGLQVVRDGSPVVQPGQPITVSLLPFPAELGVTNVANPLVDLTGSLAGTITGSLGSLDANLIPNLEPGNIGGTITSTGALGTLTPDLDPGPITGTITGTLGTLAADLTSTLTSDSAGGLVSALPVPFRLPVQIDVRWSVHKEAGAVRPPFGRPPLVLDRPLLEPDAFIALDGLEARVASFVFLPQEVTELTNNRPPVSASFIRASVTLTVDPALIPVLGAVIGSQPISITVSLPDVPILVPALAIPRVLALFRHDTFESFQEDDGFVLIVVPPSSPLRSPGQLQSVLSALDSVLSNLSALRANPLLASSAALTRFAALLLGVRKLNGALSQLHVRFRVDNAIDDLRDIHMIRRTLLGIDPLARDVRAGDEVSSLIFMGIPGGKVRCWNNSDFHNSAAGPIGPGTRDGQLLVTTGPEMIVVIPNLHSAAPATEPPGGAQAIIQPKNPDTFGDALRSFTFESPQ